MAMYEFTLWIITAAQWLIGSGLIPLVRVYMILVLASHISKEEIISNLTELLEQIIGWGLKTLIGVVLGFHVIQGLVLPYVDSFVPSSDTGNRAGGVGRHPDDTGVRRFD